MGEFIASNGVRIGLGVPGAEHVRLYEDIFTAREVDALREFFQHERDEQLGRWRWPERPDYVVTPFDGDPDHVLVVQESAGVACEFVRASAYGPSMSGYHSRLAPAARAYFDAHPVRKPWHDAEPGEVWALDHGHGERAAIVLEANTDTTGRLFSTGPTMFSPLNPTIVSARRIWPEGGES